MTDINRIIQKLSVEEKVAQLFITTPEALLKTDEPVVKFSEELEKAIKSVPIGGILYFGRNLIDAKQTISLLKSIQNTCVSKNGIPPFQCVDEEGGYISKVANNNAFGVKNIGTPTELSKKNDLEIIKESGLYVGRYLSKLGFNVDFAPCADVYTNEKNEVLETRTYGNDPQKVAEMSVAFANGLSSCNIISSFKHFPGHGDAKGDSHNEAVYVDKTIRQLYNCELIPFVNGIKNRIPMIMVSHISLPRVLRSNVPASLSKRIVTGLLRDELQYKGVIVTDSLKMKAVSNKYSSKEATKKAIKAGVDLILRPIDFFEAYDGLVQEVMSGSIEESRIDDSLRRVLKLKKKYQLM